MRGLNYLIIWISVFSLASCTKQLHTLSKTDLVLKRYSFSQLEQLEENERRPLAIFIHTDWCKFCKNMEQTTFRNKEVIQKLNRDFYFVPFNGEEKNRIKFRKQDYQYIPNGRDSGTHELAIALAEMNGSLQYPSFVILNEDDEIVFQYGSYLTAEEMINILQLNN